MTLAKGADYVLNLELTALQDQGKGELVSNPRVMTTDRCVAIHDQQHPASQCGVSANRIVSSCLRID